MRGEANDKIAKVRRFGVRARRGCTFLIGFMIVSALWIVGAILLGPVDEGARIVVAEDVLEVRGDQITSIERKLMLVALCAVVFAIIFAGLRHLRALFADFAVGSIFTSANVGRIRSLGWLVLLSAVLQLLMPPFSFLLIRAGIFDATMLQEGAAPVILTPLDLGPFVTGSLILLAAWIMDIGRETSDAAEEMRKEAELVV